MTEILYSCAPRFLFRIWRNHKHVSTRLALLQSRAFQKNQPARRMTPRSMARLLLFSRLLRRFDLQQLAALRLVGLGADGAGHLKPLAAQEIGCPARPGRMVG